MSIATSVGPGSGALPIFVDDTFEEDVPLGGASV